MEDAQRRVRSARAAALEAGEGGGGGPRATGWYFEPYLPAAGKNEGPFK